jgi:hypothetical protein
MTMSREIERIKTLLQDAMLRDRVIISGRLENILEAKGKDHSKENPFNQINLLKKKAGFALKICPG